MCVRIKNKKKNTKAEQQELLGNKSKEIVNVLVSFQRLDCVAQENAFSDELAKKKKMSDENSITQRLDIRYSTDRSSFFLSSCGSCNDFCLLMHSFFFFFFYFGICKKPVDITKNTNWSDIIL